MALRNGHGMDYFLPTVCWAWLGRRMLPILLLDRFIIIIIIIIKFFFTSIQTVGPQRQHAGYCSQHVSGSGVSWQGHMQQLQHLGIWQFASGLEVQNPCNKPQLQPAISGKFPGGSQWPRPCPGCASDVLNEQRGGVAPGQTPPTPPPEQ